MTLEISLRPSLTLPHVFQAQSGKPPDGYHRIGQQRRMALGNTEPGDQNSHQQDGRKKEGYDPLADITLGDVENAYEFYKDQLLLARENWIGKNHFCTIHLEPQKDSRPPAIFGRVKTCYPSDGYIDNIKQLELSFPRPNDKPRLLHINNKDIVRDLPLRTQSFYLRVQFKASKEEAADFRDVDPVFHVNGFFLEFQHGIYDLLEMNDQNQHSYPWLYVIGSGWFHSLPDSLQREVEAKLREMLHWGKYIINYHPNRRSIETMPLNEILGYKYKITSNYLAEPENPQEAALIVETLFKEWFQSS